MHMKSGRTSVTEIEISRVDSVCTHKSRDVFIVFFLFCSLNFATVKIPFCLLYYILCTPMGLTRAARAHITIARGCEVKRLDFGCHHQWPNSEILLAHSSVGCLLSIDNWHTNIQHSIFKWFSQVFFFRLIFRLIFFFSLEIRNKNKNCEEETLKRP